MIIRSP